MLSQFVYKNTTTKLENGGGWIEYAAAVLTAYSIQPPLFFSFLVVKTNVIN
jgi:hypothetical protein